MTRRVRSVGGVKRAWPVTIIALVLATGGLGAGVAPAAAAGPRLGLSLDGTRWGDEIRQPLFDAGDRWVPGDRREVRFWVRNTAGGSAGLQVEVLGATGTLRLGRDVVITTEVDPPPSSEATSTAESADARTSAAPRQVTVTARIPATAGDEIQGRSLSPTLLVTLTQRPGSLTDGGLAATGSTTDLVLLGGVATLLTSAGAGSLLARRRRGEPRQGQRPGRPT